MRRRKTKFFGSNLRWMSSYPPYDTIVMEFDIPNFVTYEEELQKLLEKFNLVIHNQIRYGAVNPRVRMAEGHYKNLSPEAADELMAKITQAFKKQNVSVLRSYAAYEFPVNANTNEIDDGNTLRYGIQEVQIFADGPSTKGYVPVELPPITSNWTAVKIYQDENSDVNNYHLCFCRPFSSYSDRKLTNILPTMLQIIAADPVSLAPYKVIAKFWRAVIYNVSVPVRTPASLIGNPFIQE